MKTDCSLLAEEIMSPESPLSEEAYRHLRQCRECAALRQDVTAVTQFTAPEYLKAAVMDAARHETAKRRIRRNIFRTVPWAAAAMFAAVFGITSMMPAMQESRTVMHSDVLTAEMTGEQEFFIAGLAAELNELDEASFELSQDLMSCQYLLAEL